MRFFAFGVIMSEKQDRTSMSSQIRELLLILLQETNYQKIVNDLKIPAFTDLFMSYAIFEENFFAIKYKYFEKLRDDLVHLISWRKEDFIINVKNDLEQLVKDFIKYNELKDTQKVKDSKDLEEILQNTNILSLTQSIDNLHNQVTELHLKNEEILGKNSALENAQKRALDIINEIESKNQSFNLLIDDKSNAEIKNLYEKIYIDEIKLADKYINWALLIFAVIGSFLLLGFLNLSIQNWNHTRDSSYIEIKFGWDSLLKTLMLFSLTTPAWYLTRESSKHRKVAYKAKMLGTELSSFPLYAREFKDEDRLELRKSLADRFFGQELYNDSSNTKNTNDVSIEQIKLIAEANKVLAESLKVKQNFS
jgi:hypothetical protein